MKLTVWYDANDGQTRTVHYDNVLQIKTRRAVDFSDFENSGADPSDIWTRLYLADGETATYTAENIDITF